MTARRYWSRDQSGGRGLIYGFSLAAPKVGETDTTMV